MLRGLEREDLFTVVFDPVLTDTARYADVVLPAAAFLERRELSRGYGALVLQDAEPRSWSPRARRGRTTRSSRSCAAGPASRARAIRRPPTR